MYIPKPSSLLAATLTVGWLLLAGNSAYTVTAELDDAGQIVKGNQVRIGASNVGKVTGVRLTEAGTAELELTIQDEATPLRRGFGLTFIEQVLPDQLGGDAAVTLRPGGLACTIRFRPASAQACGAF